MSRALVSVALAMLAMLGTSCGGEELTEIFVCYSIDDTLVNPDTRVTVCARDERGQNLFGCGDGLLSISTLGGTASQGFVQDLAETVRIELVGSIQREVDGVLQTSTISQAIELDFQPGRTIDVNLSIDAECINRPCAPTETCVVGTCQPVRIPNARCLSDHGEAPNRGGVCDDDRLANSCAGP